MSVFPGGVALTDLEVYEGEASDGCRGGTPHMHTASSEGYLVTAGSGAVETLSADGFAQHPLVVGDVLWFTPGTVHRLVNDGGLRLVAVMSNAGLPEAGDAVMTFPAEVLADPDRYAAAAVLPEGAGRGVAAAARRDLAIEGYLRLREGGGSALEAFQRAAVKIVRPRVARWKALWEATVLAEAEATRAQLDALERGDLGALGASHVARVEPAAGPRRFGMCGMLRTWQWE